MSLIVNQREPTAAFGYFISIMLSILMLAVSKSLGGFLPGHDFYLVSIAAVALSSWYAGSRPGLLAALVCTIFINYLLKEPPFTFKINASLAANALIFWCVSLLIIWTEDHRKRAAQALREARDELHIILNGVTDGITVQTEDGQPIFANQAAASMLGYESPAALMADSVEGRAEKFSWLDERDEIVPVADRPRAQVFQTGQPASMTFKIRVRSSDEERWILLKSAPVFNQRRQTKTAVNILHDITSQKRRDIEKARFERLAESHRKRIDRLIAHVPGVIFEGALELDSGRQRLDFVSAYAETMFGYRVEEFLENPRIFDMIIDPESRTEFEHDLSTQLKQQDTLLSQFRAIRRDGEQIICEAQFTVTRDTFGVPVSTTGFVRDITERVRYEESLMEATQDLIKSNAELEQFAYVASHDLQEPLRMITSYLQLIEQRYGPRLDSDGREFIAFAVDGARRMKNLINDLLLYSRFQRTRVAFQPLDMGDAIKQARENLHVTITDSDATITTDPMPTVIANESQMVQLWQNLIGNAIKFRGDDPPRIHISARQDAREWTFSVQDNGIGIDPMHAERIFIIFQRLHGRESHGGTGIGLAICKKIVERHNGRIWVDSAPNAGATFYFTLPLNLRKVTTDASH